MINESIDHRNDVVMMVKFSFCHALFSEKNADWLRFMDNESNRLCI